MSQQFGRSRKGEAWNECGLLLEGATLCPVVVVRRKRENGDQRSGFSAAHDWLSDKPAARDQLVKVGHTLVVRFSEFLHGV